MSLSAKRGLRRVFRRSNSPEGQEKKTSAESPGTIRRTASKPLSRPSLRSPPTTRQDASQNIPPQSEPVVKGSAQRRYTPFTLSKPRSEYTISKRLPSATDITLPAATSLSSNGAQRALSSIGEDAASIATPVQSLPAQHPRSTVEASKHAPLPRTQGPVVNTQKQLDDLTSAMLDLRKDNEFLRVEVTRINDSVLALRSEVAGLQATIQCLKDSADASAVLPSSHSGQAGDPSSKILCAQATLLAAERAEALLAKLSPGARLAVHWHAKMSERLPTSLFGTPKRTTLLSGTMQERFTSSEGDLDDKDALEKGDNQVPVLDGVEAADALAASHAVVALQHLCDLHGSASLGSIDSLLSEDALGSASLHSASGSRQKLSMSPSSSRLAVPL